MSNELVVITPKSIEEAERMSKTLAASHLLPDALRAKPADVLATVLAGAELGLAPMQAIRGIVVIKGKPTLSADTMGALVKRRRDVCEYLILKESTPERAVYETKRTGDPAATTMEFSIEDAKRAGLAGDNWRKYPAAMLRARCLSAICRAVFPDLCLGLYDPDELGPESIQATAPASAPVERDVTPKTAPKVEALKAKLEERLGVVDAEVVKVEPPTMSGGDIWKAIQAAAKESGMSEKDAGGWLRQNGKTAIAQLTATDLDTFKAHVALFQTPAPDPHADEEPPF